MDSDAPQARRGFAKNEADLVRNFLMYKALGSRQTYDEIIEIEDVYELNQENLQSVHGQNRSKWCFYTTRDFKLICPIRTHKGFYSLGTEDIMIPNDDKSKFIGIKRKFRFYLGKPTELLSATKTEWCLYEYRVNTEVLRMKNKSAETVVCVFSREPIDSLEEDVSDTPRLYSGSGDMEESMPGTSSSQ